MKIYTGDLKPDLQITLSDSGSDRVDVSDATAIRIIGKRGKTIIFDRPPTSYQIVGATSVLSMEFEAGDTDTVGQIKIEVEVMWPDDKPQTFAPSSSISVKKDFDIEDAS